MIANDNGVIESIQPNQYQPAEAAQLALAASWRQLVA